MREEEEGEEEREREREVDKYIYRENADNLLISKIV